MLKAALIGCGRVAWMLEDDPLEVKPCTHMGAYRALENEGLLKVVAAADTDAARLEAFGGRFGVKGLYGDYREMLKTEAPEVVSIAAWATERHGMVLDAIEAGVKGIWCEKAFGTSLSEAREMAGALRKNDVKMIVSHLRRWSPEFVKARRMIEEGAIGSLTSIVAHFSGSLLHTGTHAFDVLLWFMGPAVWVEGEIEGSTENFIWDEKSDPGGRATIGFSNGAYATVHAESREYFFFEFDITGTRGRIRIGNNDLLEYYMPEESRHYTGFRELAKKPFPAFEKSNAWVEALKDLVRSIDDNGATRNGPDDGLASLELALAIHASAKSGGARVALPLRDTGIKVRSR